MRSWQLGNRLPKSSISALNTIVSTDERRPTVSLPFFFPITARWCERCPGETDQTEDETDPKKNATVQKWAAQKKEVKRNQTPCHHWGNQKRWY